MDLSGMMPSGAVDLWGLLTILDGDDVEFDGPDFKFNYEIGVIWEVDGTTVNTRSVEESLARFIKKKNKALGVVADLLLEGIKQLAPTNLQHQIAIVIFWECDCECVDESANSSGESIITPANFGGSPFEGFDANNPLPDEMTLFNEISSEKWSLWSRYLDECKRLCTENQ